MSGAIASAAVAPVMATASVRAEQVTQLVLGDTAEVLETAGEWRRIRAHEDRYEGWVNAGYLVEASDESVAMWRESATGFSLGATVDLVTHVARLPLRARVTLQEGGVRLPDGRTGALAGGAVQPLEQVVAEARRVPAERWAWAHFAGSPYQWGGRTPWGVDCSGLVQATFAARGVALPRDASQQVRCGDRVSEDAVAPGDLLFFRGESGEAITHVAFAAEADTLIHSTIACGGVVHEPWDPGTRAGHLRARLVAVRRLSA